MCPAVGDQAGQAEKTWFAQSCSHFLSLLVSQTGGCSPAVAPHLPPTPWHLALAVPGLLSIRCALRLHLPLGAPAKTEFSLWNCSAKHPAHFLVDTTVLCMGLSAWAVLPQVLPCVSHYFSSEVAQQALDSEIKPRLEMAVLLRGGEGQVLGLCECHSRGQAEQGSSCPKQL